MVHGTVHSDQIGRLVQFQFVDVTAHEVQPCAQTHLHSHFPGLADVFRKAVNTQSTRVRTTARQGTQIPAISTAQINGQATPGIRRCKDFPVL